MKPKKSKHLDPSIKALKTMLGDQSNELGSERKRALAMELRKLTKLKKQRHTTYEETYRIVGEVAKAILEARDNPQQSEDRS